jgi:PAS domain S-box-containing protein
MPRLDFESVFESSPNSYMLLDRDLRFVAANAAYLRALSVSRDDLIGRLVFEVFPHNPDDPNNESARLLRDSFERVLKTRAPDVIAFIPYRVPYQREGQLLIEERLWSATHTPILDERGEVAFILQHTVDVTELAALKSSVEEAGILKRAEVLQRRYVNLDAELQHLRSLFDQAPGFICVLRGPEHVFEVVNSAYYQLIGHREILGKPVRQALPEFVGQGFFEQLDRVHETGLPFVGRSSAILVPRHRGGDLDERFVDFVYQPIVNTGGQVTGIFVQGHDITAQKEAEERQRFLAESIPQQVWTADPAGDVTFLNQRGLDYFGATADQVVGSGWLNYVHPDDVEACLTRWKRSLTTGDEYEVEFQLRRSDGTYCWHLGRAEPYRDATGAIATWFGTNTNIDDRKRAQDTLEERNEFEQHLIGIVSHDLRNPINAIGIAAALLRDRGGLDERQSKAVARISSSAARARHMIRDFLDFTEARSAGRVPVSPAAANIREIARHVFDEVHLVYRDRQASIEHHGEEAGHWDPERIAQVIGNLLANAFQHGAADGPVRLITCGTDREVSIQVRNSGVPIPAEDLPRLFEPFERGAGTTPSSTRSVGLGLFISKQIVAAHGGTIDVRSNANDGTIFTVRLPR